MPNCKPGDLAVVIRAGKHATNCIGKIVKCVEPTTSVFGHPAWFVEPKLHNNAGQELWYAEDSALRPLPPPTDVETHDRNLKEPTHEHA